MSKINSQRFTVEAFKEQASWISPLLANLNQFIGEVISGFSNGLTIEENLFQEIKELKFVNQTANFPLKFRTKFAQFPKGVQVVFAYDNTTETMDFASAPWANWTYNNGEISITSITGLTSGHTYTFRFHVIYK